jgi:signal transduction histidine kinase
MKLLGVIQRNAEPIIGALVLGAAFVLLLLSSDTGKERYDTASHELDRVEAVNARLDAALLALRFGLHTDFDLVTDLQQQLQLASAGLSRPVDAGNGASVELTVAQKLESIEEFKAQQAIVRNSIAIAEEMLKELWAQRARDNDANRNADTLIEMERALLRYVSEGDYSSGQSLETKMAAAERARPELTSVEEWELLAAHVKNLLRRRADLEALLNGLFSIPLAETVAAERRGAERAYAVSATTAGRYRVALFVVAMLLLAFSTWKVAQVRGYVRLIEGSNATLEEHVAKRTKELRDSNASLHSEIREREEVEAQLRLAQKLESIGQLAAGIAHEINTPVQYVSDNLAFLAATWQDMQPLIDDYQASLKHADTRRLEIWSKADMDFVRSELPIALGAAGAGLKHISRIVLAMKEFSHPGSEELQPADINRAIDTTITIAKTNGNTSRSCIPISAFCRPCTATCRASIK